VRAWPKNNKKQNQKKTKEEEEQQQKTQTSITLHACSSPINM
jgi:hypothetical protein